MTDERRGRGDLHVHTLASDGTNGVLEILDHVAGLDLDVIGIADHDRIDAGLAARAIAADRGLPFDVIVGEEVSSLGGHVLALFVETRIRSLRTLSATIAEIHDAGGIAIPAHPLVPYPLCAQGWVLRGLLDRSDERFHPDAIEAFNPTMLGRPWHPRVVRFAEQHGFATVGNSDAHALGAIGSGWTEFEGRTAAELRAAIAAHATTHHGTFHGTGGQVRTFGRQLAKYSRDARAELGGRLRRDGTRRDLGYPAPYGPNRYDRAEDVAEQPAEEQRR
jgi:predicted metal-dependent phosphoesterase TrpH